MFVDGIFHQLFHRFGEGLLGRHHHRFGIAVEMAEIVCIHHLQQGVDIQIAIDQGPGIGGMVILAVKIQKLLIAELRDHLRIASGRKSIGRIGKLGLVAAISDQRVRAGIGPLHFVVNHAPDFELALGVVELIMPAFLMHNLGLLINAGKKHRVHIYPAEIHEILIVCRGNRIDGHVR